MDVEKIGAQYRWQKSKRQTWCGQAVSVKPQQPESQRESPRVRREAWGGAPHGWRQGGGKKAKGKTGGKC